MRIENAAVVKLHYVFASCNAGCYCSASVVTYLVCTTKQGFQHYNISGNYTSVLDLPRKYSTTFDRRLLSMVRRLSIRPLPAWYAKNECYEYQRFESAARVSSSAFERTDANDGFTTGWSDALRLMPDLTI
jgi:hypothetical protein